MESIEFSGTIDGRVYSRALQLYDGGAGVVSLLWVAVGVYGLASSRTDEPATWGMPLTVLLAGSLVLIIVMRGALRTLPRKLLRSHISGKATTAGLLVRSPSGDENILWNQFDSATNQRDLVLLHSSSQQAYVVASKFFASQDAWFDFRYIVRERVRDSSPIKSSLISVAIWAAMIAGIFLAWN